MDELEGGIRRVTLPLPTRPGHVHAYLLPGEDGWIVVDTGVGLPDAKERWAAELAEAGGRVAAIFVTHFHPDHVGAAADLHELTGAPVHQGVLDYAQCELVWGNPAWSERLLDWFRLHGTPDDVTAELVGQSSLYRPFIRYQRDPVLMEPGERLDGWELVAASGHADGQLCLVRDGVLVAADHVLGRITPTVGLWPASRPDPLGDYLEALERTAELAPRLALPGHGDPLQDPAGRARELQEHHRLRLEEAAAALDDAPRSGYELSFALFGEELKPAGRRFAIAETLSHLERLVQQGAAERADSAHTVAYTAIR
jgi:glyoxylase-like metal-dependent hydrolase (beta-lactamase superfamily II)